MLAFRTMLFMFVLLAVSLLQIGCAGGGNETVELDKHITCVLHNNSFTDVAFKMSEYPSFDQFVPAGGSSTNSGFELKIFSDSSPTWSFTVVDTHDNTLVSRTFTWTLNQGQANSQLLMAYNADGTLIFVPAP